MRSVGDLLVASVHTTYSVDVDHAASARAGTRRTSPCAPSPGRAPARPPRGRASCTTPGTPASAAPPLPRLGVRDPREPAPGLGLALERQLVEDVEDAMVPAPLLLRLRKHRGQRPPDAEMAVADHELRRVESASLEIPQDGRPALRRLAIAALDGEEDLLPVPQGRQDDEDRGLLLLQPGFHVHAVHPEVDDLEVLERARLPELVLGLPARLEARDRRRRQRGAVAEQPAQGEIEVALGQAMQVELREK